MDLSFESYLYPAGMTHLEMALPIHLHPGGWAGHGRAVAPARHTQPGGSMAGQVSGRADQFVGYTRSGRHVGQRMAALAAAAGKPVGEFAFDLVMEEEGAATLVFPGRRRWRSTNG